MHVEGLLAALPQMVEARKQLRLAYEFYVMAHGGVCDSMTRLLSEPILALDAAITEACSRIASNMEVAGYELD